MNKKGQNCKHSAGLQKSSSVNHSDRIIGIIIIYNARRLIGSLIIESDAYRNQKLQNTKKVG